MIAESDQLNAERNTASREIGALMKDGRRDEADARRKAVNELKERIAELDQKREQSETRMRELLSTLPNIPHESVPSDGRIRQRRSPSVGHEPDFDFEPKITSIWNRAWAFSILSARPRLPVEVRDSQRAGARLSRALIDFMLDLHTREHGYQETLPPSSSIVNHCSAPASCLNSRRPFKIEDERRFYLVPTAEVSGDQLLSRRDSRRDPIAMKWAAYTPCFRSEAAVTAKTLAA